MICLTKRMDIKDVKCLTELVALIKSRLGSFDNIGNISIKTMTSSPSVHDFSATVRIDVALRLKKSIANDN